MVEDIFIQTYCLKCSTQRVDGFLFRTERQGFDLRSLADTFYVLPLPCTVSFHSLICLLVLHSGHCTICTDKTRGKNAIHIQIQQKYHVLEKFSVLTVSFLKYWAKLCKLKHFLKRLDKIYTISGVVW